MTIWSWLSRGRGLGWLPQPTDYRDYPANLLGVSSTDAVPAEVSLKPHITRVLDQGPTQACVAHALAHAIDLLETRAGLKYVPISRRFVYFNARRFHETPVVDAGTYIRTAAKGLKLLGAPDEDLYKWKTGPIAINRRPGWAPYMQAHARRNGGYYHVFSKGEERLGEIRAALAAGHPVVFGTRIAVDFLKNDGPEIIECPAQGVDLLGGHAMVLIGYCEDDAAGPVFEVVNSWGTSWRAGGYAYLTAKYLTWPWTTDFTIIEGWDRLKTGEGEVRT